MENKRDITIDILKTIGILMIILAHTNPPDIIVQFRSFDVPLLIIISGLLGAQSYSKKKSGFKYFIKRITRLALPVWIFLTIFIVISFVSKIIGLDICILNLKTIMRSYLLLDGIGYVWIVRVYILCAIMLPLLIKIKKEQKISISAVLILGIYVIYEILYYFIGNKNPIMKYIAHFF